MCKQINTKIKEKYVKTVMIPPCATPVGSYSSDTQNRVNWLKIINLNTSGTMYTQPNCLIIILLCAFWVNNVLGSTMNNSAFTVRKGDSQYRHTAKLMRDWLVFKCSSGHPGKNQFVNMQVYHGYLCIPFTDACSHRTQSHLTEMIDENRKL